MCRIDNEIGLRLKIARKATGFQTALDFANKMNIPKSTYSQHENGKRSLTAEQIIQYAQKLDIEPGWLLTGLGHPCPSGKNKARRKEEIDQEIAILQKTNELPIVKNVHVEIDDNYAVVNMELFGKIIIAAIKALASSNFEINAEELATFCIDVYNNIEFIIIAQDEKEKIINLSVNSMLRGNSIILKQAINV